MTGTKFCNFELIMVTYIYNHSWQRSAGFVVARRAEFRQIHEMFLDMRVCSLCAVFIVTVVFVHWI